MKSKTITSAILVFLILANLISVSAITGSIGNARMILHAEQGDEIDKYILVKNVNDVPLDIELSASGDLADYVDIKDEKFILAAGEEKQAQFTIKVAKAGTTETRINVKFTPIGGGNGVGLSSTIIIIAEENSFWSDLFGNDDEEEEKQNETDENGVTVTTGKSISDTDKKMSPAVTIILIMTLITAAVLIYLLVLLYKKVNKQDIKIKRITKSKRVQNIE